MKQEIFQFRRNMLWKGSFDMAIRNKPRKWPSVQLLRSSVFRRFTPDLEAASHFRRRCNSIVFADELHRSVRHDPLVFAGVHLGSLLPR